MALLPTGSDRILDIRTSTVNLVIKSKKNLSGGAVATDSRCSSLVVDGIGLEQIKVESQEVDLTFCEQGYIGTTIDLFPMFFEQTDYEIIIRSRHGESIGFWNENYLIREKIGPVMDGDDSLLTGIINFDNSVGYSDLEISIDGKRVLTVRLEVFPSKISYKEDYQRMIADVSDMVYAAAIDFMQKTYQEFALGNTQSTVPAIFFQLIRSIFDKYMNAANRIIIVPHHKLVAEYTIVPEHKAKRTDRHSEKWLRKHTEYIDASEKDLNVSRILAVKKRITYDTNENRFVKFILKTTIQKIENFLQRYQRAVMVNESTVVNDAERMIQQIHRVLNTSFLKDVADFGAAESMSLVFSMAPGYRELYKYYLMLQRGLSVHGDFFRISVKDTAQLYEYWCFIKLFNLLKNEYQLVTPDIIKVDNSGITVTLVKGKRSEGIFINPRTGEQIKLVYNPGESKTQTVNQRPDNVLELEKKGSEVSYKYVFDAKYRIESNPDSSFYPDTKPGPKVDDINTMHRYRDSIVYENKQSKFTFEKTMFGAYILFPYDQEDVYKQHRFYKSIDTVNIGGLPFLPGATKLVEKLLDELISDSKESAFERTTLPRGIEEKLAVVNWDERDVLIGTFRSREQFDTCYKNHFYYIPARLVSDDKLPIHYVALYQTDSKFGADSGIRYYGEVLRMALVRRKNITEIPVRRGNGEELYYKIMVRTWDELSKPIMPKEKGFIFAFTNMFLLQHSEYVQELLIESGEQYRFYSELKRSVNSATINEDSSNLGFDYDDVRFTFAAGKILAIRNGAIITSFPISEFARKPAATYRKLLGMI